MKSGWRGTEAFKWMGFVTAIWLQVINGTNFDFSDYSSVLKEVLDIDQVQLNNLAVASDLGKALGWLSGLASLYLPLWTVLLIAGCLGIVGYGVQWLSLVSKIAPLAYWQAFLLCILAGNSICWFNTVSYLVCIRNFANERSFALGLSTSYVGLSAAVYTSVQTAIAPHAKSLFLLLNAVVPTVVCLLSLPFIGGAEQKERAQMQRPFLAVMSYGIAIVTGVYLLLLDFQPLSSSGQLNALILLGLLLAPVSLPATVFITELRNQADIKRRQAHRDARVLAIDVLDEKDEPDRKSTIEITEVGKRDSKSKDETEIELPLQIQDQEATSPSGSAARVETEPKSRRVVLGEDHNTIQLIRSIDFWLFFLVYLCGGTLGLVFISNLGQIAESRGYSKASILVSLSSSSSFFGRLASSAPDYLLRFKICIPRPAWIGISMVPMAASFFLLLINDSVALYVGTAILGFFTGMVTSIAISITSELFGLKNFGVNHNIVVVNIPLGSLALGYLAGIFYDDRAKKNKIQANQLSAPPVHRIGSTVCHGAHCYNDTFLIWGSVCVIGIVLSFILSFRTRAFYQRLHCQNHHVPNS